MSRRRAPRRRRRSTAAPRWRRRLGVAALVVLVVGVVYVVYLDFVVRGQFEGKRWALPARVFARPLELYPGRALTPEQFARELAMLRYRQDGAPDDAGSFARRGNGFDLVTRPFEFWDGREPSTRLRVTFADGHVARLERAGGEPVALARLDPVHIGGIYPLHNEDRVLVRLADVPEVFVEGLIAVEDRRFREHAGVDLEAVARAAWANLRAGGIVQGGSTLTQQLVKNFYLTNERTLWRKANEAVMAVLLEVHYDKDAILEAYLNEVYLGQDRARAIHGFGLASRFYFDRSLRALDLHQMALLVALVKGPGHYDPRRHPERARARRDVVLDVMAGEGVIERARAERAQSEPLDVIPRARASLTEYPAFVELVRRQLRRDYRDEDLRSEGLRVFTTLDPIVQWRVERSVAGRLARLEGGRGLPEGSLQGAAVVTGTQDGEVQALVGGRDARYSGFNRALDARRPVGSLIKPAVYLTALTQPRRYTLVSPLEDAPLRVEGDGGRIWEPSNYDDRFRGDVPLFEALAHSYNVPTVRLGLDVGVGAVRDTLQRLGVDRELDPYPSLLLGAAELSPVTVARMYQTLAAGGFRTPLRAVREVRTADGEPLQRYPLAVQRAFDAGPVYLLDHALQRVIAEGTASGLGRRWAADVGAAGKTGTTDGLRDSWFAGFTGERLAVVWVGRDDNAPTGLTGAAGAMRVWGDIMTPLKPRPLRLPQPDGVEWHWVRPETERLADAGCGDAVRLPFIEGSAPRERDPCAGGPVDRAVDWLRGLFRGDEASPDNGAAPVEERSP